MALTILSAKDYIRKLKVTIQATGRLGFTEETARTLGLSPEKYVKIARDDENGQFFLGVSEVADEDAFKVCAAGPYYYLNTTGLFTRLGIDFKTKTVMFDLKRSEEFDAILGGQAYSMEERIVNRKKEGGNNM